MKTPNFFILGAPKCGTTSMAAWLSEHPDIFMSSIKEPHWFNLDQNYHNVKNFSEYQKLFNNTENYAAVGEASVWYLYSKVAVKEILSCNPRSKFIVMVRNPLEMVVSLHGQMLLSSQENLISFPDAWDAQKERKRGVGIPGLCREPTFLQYGDACSLGMQLEKLYSQVERDNVLVILLDDIRQDALGVYRRVLEYLSVPDDGRIKLPVMNVAQVSRSHGVKKAVQYIGNVKRSIGVSNKGLGILTAIQKVNSSKQSRSPLDEVVKNDLIDYFYADVNKLSSLIERDLSHWVGGRV